jgi:uncharacterized membrane protein YhhN
MKKKYWIILFLVILASDLIAVQFNHQLAEYIFKPLIVACLVTYFIAQVTGTKSSLKKWVIGALLFSFTGDVLLMLQANNSIFFLYGLSAFLVAHFFYILFFHFIRLKENIKSRWFMMLIVVAYYLVMIVFLSPYLGDMKLPVRIYAIVISFMFMLAMHMLFIRNKRAGHYMMLGSLLFVSSDSILAINKFYQSCEIAGVTIMLTYGLAQLFITEGAIRYINSGFKE